MSRLLEATVDIPDDLLDSLADHLTVCGTEHRRRLHREQRRSAYALYTHNIKLIASLCKINFMVFLTTFYSFYTDHLLLAFLTPVTLTR